MALRDRRFASASVWRLPALLSTAGLLALLAWPFLGDHPTGSYGREALAFVLALGACAVMLGLGTGLWLAARIRTRKTVLVAAWAITVAFIWWFSVFSPLIRGERL